MGTRTITGNIHDLTDTAVSSGVVTFEKVVTSTTGNTIHQFGVTTDTTDGSGNFSIDLAVPASGSYRYRMILPNGDSFYFSIAAGASVNVATLIVAETITDSDAIVEALAAYVPLSGGTLTGQINFSGTTHAGIKLLSLTTAQRDALTPANGMVIYNSTTATGQIYQGSAWASVGSGGAVSSVFGRTGAVVAASGDYLSSQITDNSTYGASAPLSESIDNLQQDIQTVSSTKQDSSAKLTAIAALTWAANNIILLTGTATASVQALAAHVVTFLQSASAADARTAIGAGTGNGDLLAANNLSELTATQSTARTNLGLGTLATQNGSFTGGGTLATGGFTLTVPATGTATLLATYQTFTAGKLFAPPGSGSLPIETVAINSTTSTVTNNLQLGNSIGGSPAAGFGAAINLLLKTSTTYGTQTGRFVWLWETATHASRVPDGVFYLTDSAAEREIWRGRATGSAAAIGFLGASPVARQAHIADAAGDDATTVNAILDVLEAFGLVATS